MRSRRRSTVEDKPNNKADHGNKYRDKSWQRDGIMILRKVIQLHNKHSANDTANQHQGEAHGMDVLEITAQRADDTGQHKRNRDPCSCADRLSHCKQDNGQYHHRHRKGERAGRHIEIIQPVEMVLYPQFSIPNKKHRRRSFFPAWCNSLLIRLKKTGSKDHRCDRVTDECCRKRQDAVRNTGKDDHLCRPTERDTD